MDKLKLVSELLTAISGVILFLSVSKWVDLNGYHQYALLFTAFGILLLFLSEYITKYIPFDFIKKPLVLTISHISIYIGIKDYLSFYMSNYAVILAIIGILLLSYSKEIAGLFFKDG